MKMPRYIYIYTFFVALTLSLSFSCAMHSTRKWMVGILVSFWDVLFSEAMLVLGRADSIWEMHGDCDFS